MASIDTYTAIIESASRGEEVRAAIVSALNAINDGPTSNVPTPTTSDSGKYLRVDSSGNYVLATVPNAEGVSF